jgi:hypothetical protein
MENLQVHLDEQEIPTLGHDFVPPGIHPAQPILPKAG